MKTLKINIITNNNQYGLTNDAKILVSTLMQISKTSKHFNFQVRPVNFYSSECGSVDINFFLELPNPLLIHTAKINILVPNQEWFFKDWTNYLHLFDFVWCKTKLAKQILSEHIDTSKLIYVGWNSIDKFSLKFKKNMKSFLHVAGRSILKGSNSIIESWKPDWPVLSVIYNKQSNHIVEKSQDNIIYYSERLDDDTLNEMMNTSGIHLCPSEAEGFGHYINEARSTQSIVVTTNSEPMNTFTKDKYLVNTDKQIDMELTFGVRNIFDKVHFTSVIEDIISTDVSELVKDGKEMRKLYLDNIISFRKNLLDEMYKLTDILGKNTFVPKIPEEINSKVRELPFISIVSLTYNRKNFFPLALMNYKGIDYPEELIEWIIVDDSNESDIVEDLIPKDLARVRYIKLEGKHSIGEKRNIGCKESKGDYIAFMDDDDIYQPRHLLIKLAYLKHYNKPCCYSTSIGCFHIEKLISTINVPPMEHSPEKRVSEATMMFQKSFWENRKFDSLSNGSEGGSFIKDRYVECVEVPWRQSIISLLHDKNTSNRVKNIGSEPNGCHFGLSDELFSFITNINNTDSVQIEDITDSVQIEDITDTKEDVEN